MAAGAQNRFSGAVTVFHEHRLPERATLAVHLDPVIAVAVLAFGQAYSGRKRTPQRKRVIMRLSSTAYAA